MRAVVFHGPGDLRYEDVPWPQPGPGEIVLRIEAALTCGTDVKVRRRGHPVMIPRVPTVFGHEFAGKIAAVGAGVVGWREGERVVAANSAPCGECRLCLAARPNLCEDLLFVNGAYAEAIALPSRLVRRNVVRLSPAVPAARAAFAEPLACALGAIERARVESGQSVVIFGAGPLGCLLGMVAVARKARVIMVGKRGWRLDQVRRLGIGECLEATASPDIVGTLHEAIGGRGPDVAVDATGRPEVWEQAMAAVGRGGAVRQLRLEKPADAFVEGGLFRPVPVEALPRLGDELDRVLEHLLSRGVEPQRRFVPDHRSDGTRTASGSRSRDGRRSAPT